jgi:hypothetical protein
MARMYRFQEETTTIPFTKLQCTTNESAFQVELASIADILAGSSTELDPC